MLGQQVPKQDFTPILRQLYASIRARSEGAVVLTEAEIWTIWKRAAGRCEYTRIPFSLTRIKGATSRPWAPSIDRIDCGIGYEFSNCRMVCNAVNIALSQFGSKVLKRIARAVLYKPDDGEQ